MDRVTNLVLIDEGALKRSGNYTLISEPGGGRHPGRLHLDQAPRGVSHAALVADAHGVASAGPAAR